MSEARPNRVQLSRAKGARKPAGAVVVARPTRWGNPFDFRKAADAGYGDGRGAAVDAFRGWLNGEDWGSPNGVDMAKRREAILAGLADLRGKDLACWCPLNRPCHADVLIEMANKAGACL